MNVDNNLIQRTILNAARLMFLAGRYSIGHAARDKDGSWCHARDPEARYFSIAGAIDLVTFGNERLYRASMDHLNHFAINNYLAIDSIAWQNKTKDFDSVIKFMIFGSR
jgi:hypothetical protein